MPPPVLGIYRVLERIEFESKTSDCACLGRIVGHSETGPEWVLAEITLVKSRHVRLAENGLRQRPQKHRAASLICVFRYTSTARGPPVAPPLASSLHSSFHCRWCLLALYCGRLGRFRSRAGCRDYAGPALTLGLFLEPCGEVLLLARVL